jgi:endonuclease YncB( thermonuclease family)
MSRRRVLQGTGVLLLALTVWVLVLVGVEVARQPTPLPGFTSASGSTTTTPQPEAACAALITEVLATDRLMLEEGQTVQLAAIEVPAPGQPLAEQGKQAARALALGQTVCVEGDPQAAYVSLMDGQLLQTLLIAGGYARVAEDAPESEVLATLREAETQARTANLGLWGTAEGAALPTLPPTSEPVACEPSLVPGDTIGAEEAAASLGRTVSVVFFPAQATTRNGAVTLQAGTSAENFGVVIPAGLASTVEDPGARYVSRCLLVAGRVERGADGGPRITLRSFDELQVLR